MLATERVKPSASSRPWGIGRLTMPHLSTQAVQGPMLQAYDVWEHSKAQKGDPLADRCHPHAARLERKFQRLAQKLL